ncbi:unnamed protein product [Cylindrotheca closterium]|uniref:Uncharacterized protein n=1 Tax=Cylindrotheca closterium TaxID=2856 RepID=A0AAD2FHH8_9STRA|nr:unnamed protein product [Cylindrotheca closterium]
MGKRKTGKGPRAQRVSENDSYHAPVSLVQKERGKVDKICPFDASAFLGLLDDDDSDEIADDDEDNKTPHSQKANWDSYYISSYPVPQEQAKMVQSCPFSAAFLGFPDDARGPINTVFDDDGGMATEKASSTSALSTPMVVLQDAEEDIPFQKHDQMAQQLFSFFAFGGKNGIADRHEAPLWKHGSPATPCKVSRLAETAGPWVHVALLTIIICSANWMPSPLPTPCNNPTLGKDLLQSNCYRFLHPPVDWQMPQFDFALWMFKCWHSSLLHPGNSPLICGFTMPGHNLLSLTLFASP